MSAVEKFSALLEEADSSFPPESNDRWRCVIDFANQNPQVLEQPHAAYGLGLAWYNIPESSRERFANAKKFLELAIEKNHEDWYASLYLGHLYFDNAQYREALECFLRIPELAFSGRNQAWRDLKRIELCICCHFKLGQTAALIKAFEELILMASRCKEIDTYTVHELPQLLAALAQQTNHAG